MFSPGTRLIASSIPGDVFGAIENPEDFDVTNHARLVAIGSGDSVTLEWLGNSDVPVKCSHFAISLLMQEGAVIPEHHKNRFKNYHYW